MFILMLLFWLSWLFHASLDFFSLLSNLFEITNFGNLFLVNLDQVGIVQLVLDNSVAFSDKLGDSLFD